MSEPETQLPLQFPALDVISRLNNDRGHDDKIAWPVLDYAAIGADGDFRGPMNYNLETIPLQACNSEWCLLRWTKKIPVDIKNLHRKFWGFKPLKAKA